MREFYHKSEGRIYTDTKEHVGRIAEIIKEMDEFEYDYLPDDLISEYEGNWNVVYVGKFEIDLEELEKRCYAENIPCGCILTNLNYNDSDTYFSIDYQSIVRATLNFYMTGFWTIEQVLKSHKMDYLIKE